MASSTGAVANACWSRSLENESSRGTVVLTGMGQDSVMGELPLLQR
jgi:hypothetical protein